MHARNQTRREFLRQGAAAVALSPLLHAVAAAAEYAGFKVGIQSYSLRGFSVDQALQHSRALGLKYWESFRAHLPISATPAVIEGYRKKLQQAGITLYAYGVEPFTANEEQNRLRFEFARAMGIKVLTADPTPDSFDLLDKLVEEYGIRIAIHNHGPGARYDKISDTLNAIKNHHDYIGACIDTGHYIRSNEDPVEAVEAFGKRTYSIHLKDVKTLPGGRKKFTILGEGDLQTVKLLQALRRIRFQDCLALEYEENPKNPIADIKQCLRTLRDACRKLG